MNRKNEKMTTCIFIRHASTKTGISDKLRPISDVGIAQAKKCTLLLKSETPFDLAITSSALRTKETLKIILDQLVQTPKIIEIASIYEPTSASDQAEVEKILNTLGEASLEAYIESDINNSWSRYEKSAIADLLSILEEYKPNRVLIVGHGNIINALGLALAPAATKLKHIYFNNCDGFEISDGKLVRLITKP